MSKKAAVLGSPIEHSLSPVLHRAGYAAAGIEDEWTYERFEVKEEELPSFVAEHDDFRGFSVTMPGKFAALEFADEATQRARSIGAANTLVGTSRGWRADNTDCEGVAGCLKEIFGPTPHLRKAVILGAGGTARPALWALADAGVTQLTILNRSNRLAEFQELAALCDVELSFAPLREGGENSLVGIIKKADVVVSTVPSAALEGLEPLLSHAPLVDVIYDPWPTSLAIRMAANGYPVVGGHSMLAHQAFSQFEQFTGVEAPRKAMRAALEEHLRSL